VKQFFIYLYFSASMLSLPLTVTGQFTEETRDSLANYTFKEAVSLYDRMIKQNSFIYNGRIYTDNYEGIQGHPYFMEDSWLVCEILYNKERFDSLFLKYDIYKDQVILKDFNEEGRLSPIILNNQHIDALSIQDHTFNYLEGDTLINMTPGLYDELYSGVSVKLYAKRKKEIIETTKWNDLWEDFQENDIYYMRKDGTFLRIKNLNSLKKAFREHKKEMKGYIRNNNLRYSGNFEESLIRAISYFEKL